uniref:Protein AHNAK2 n=1 Tax=Meleagris gallopavo TaxID=9103 RepID=A0A803YI06_MELGA
MYRSKTEQQDKQKKEINATLLYEKQKIHKEDISLEGPEILTVEYTASASEMKTEELNETSTKDLKDVENGIPMYAKKCPEVEISIKKEKEKESTLKEKQAEDDKQIPTIQKTKFWMSVPKRKETDTKKILTKPEIDVSDSVPETQADKEIDKGRKMDMKAQIPATEKEESTWKITIPSIEMATLPVDDIKIEDSKIDVEYTVKKDPTEERNKKRSDRSSKIEIIAKKGEKDVDGKESKQRLPKFKLPTFTWGTTKDETLKHEIPVSETMTASAPKVDASLPEAEVKAGAVDISISAPDIKPPSVEGSLDLQAPKVDLKVPSAEGSLDGAELEAAGLKGKFKMPKFDKPKFGVSVPKAEGPEGEVSLPTAEVELPSGTVTVTGEGPSLDLKADVSGAKTEGAGWKLEKPSLKMPKADIKAPKVDISLPSVKAPEKEATKAKDGKFKMPKFGMPSFGWSIDVTLPGAEIQAPGAEVTIEAAAGADAEKGRFKMPDVKMPSVKLPKVKAPHVQVSLPKAEISLPKPRAKSRRGGGMKLHMPKVKVPSVAFSKPTVKAPKVDVTTAKATRGIAPGAEVTIEAAAGADAEKGRFKMPDVKMPSVKLPKVKAPHVQVSLPKAEISLPKAQGEIPEGELALQGPDAEGSLDVAAGKAEGGGMKLHMPKVKVPSVAFSKPTVKAPKVDVDVSVPKVDASLPEAEVKAGAVDISISAPDIKPPSVEGSLDLQAPKVDLKVPSAEGSLDGAELEAAGLKGKFKMPKFDKPKFGVSVPKAEGPEGEVSLPTAEVKLPSGTVTVTGEGPSLDLKADVSGAKTEGAGWKLEKPSLKMPKADIKAPKVDISLPSVDITLPKAGVDLQAPEAALSLEGEVKAPEKEATKAKDGKFKMPKFGMPSFGWSSSREAKGTVAADVDVSLKEPPHDITLPGAEIQAPDIAVTSSSSSVREDSNGKSKGSLFSMHRVSLSKRSKLELQSKSTTECSESESICYSVTEESPAVISGSVGSKPAPDFKGDSSSKSSKFRIPSLGFSKVDISSSKFDPDSPLSKEDITLTKYQMNVAESESKISSSADMNISFTDFEILNAEGSCEQGSIKPGRVKSPTAELCVSDTEYTVKIPKFRKPKFGISWSKGKPPEIDVGSKSESQFSQEKMTSETFDIENPAQIPESEFGLNMPKPSPEFVMGPSVLDVSLPSPEVTMQKLEKDIHGPECRKEHSGEKDTEEKESKFKMSKFKLLSFNWSPKKEAVAPSEAEGHLEESEVEGPKIEMDISMPAGEVILTACEQDDLNQKSAAVDIPSSGTKMTTEALLEVKSPEASVERISSEIAMSSVEIKVEGPEGKTKMSKFQMPKFGMTNSKGKGSEKEVSQTKSEAKVPQLKATIEIADIAVEAPNLEVECTEGKESSSSKLKITKAEKKASEADTHFPMGEISISKTDSDIQDSDMVLKIKEETKHRNEDGEEKEGHFKMPKFKLPSFSWSPKKEATVKADSEANLEDNQVAVSSGGIDTEVEGTVADDQGPRPAVDLEIPAGKDQQKSPIKKPQFVMPKISLSKIKIPKSQGHSLKVEAGSTVTKTERDGVDSIQIPDIERSHSTQTEEGAQISIKTAAVKIPTLELSKTEAFQADLGVSSAKIDTAPTVSEESFQQVVLKSSSDKDSIQKTGIEFPKGETSAELRSTKIATEGSLVMDGRKMKLEGHDVQIKMPKFQKPKFGISLTKGKGPDPEISSPKLEAELPQLKMTAEVADITGRVPASEFTSDMADPGLEVCASKAKTPQVLTAVIEAPKVDISPQSESKAVTEGHAESLKEKEIKTEEEMKAEEAQTEEHQGWFKMPKFRIPAFGRTSLKEKKGDTDVERSLEKPQAGIPSARTGRGEFIVLIRSEKIPEP